MTAVLVAAVAAFVGFTIQPRRMTLAPPTDGTIPGVLHIHTNRSDGLSGPDDIAAAAARAGLKFIVFTDHGDATRRPDPPAYRSGVLCLDGVEISTTGGHYVALGMPPAPYPLGGEPRDVIEDVHRLGGFGIAAHPDSPKLELRWREWAAPFDGIEIVTVPGLDAHAKLALRDADPGDSQFVVPAPGYEASFRLLSLHIRPERALSGNADDDAGLVLGAIREGHVYTAIDGVATPPSLELTATNASGSAQEGDELKTGGPVTLHVRTNAPPSFTAIVYDGIKVVSADHHEPDFSVTLSDKPAVYWVQIRSTGGRWPQVPWVSSNPVYVRGPDPVTRPFPRSPVRTSQPLFDGKSAAGWRVEHDPTSLAAVEPAAVVGGNELRFRFGLSGQITPPPFVALAFDTPGGIAPNDRLGFTIRAERPMRISVQVRVPRQDGEAERWQRTVYVSPTDEERTVYFDELSPIGATHTYRPPLNLVRTILFVVDPVNTKRKTSARIWVRQVALQR